MWHRKSADEELGLLFMDIQADFRMRHLGIRGHEEYWQGLWLVCDSFIMLKHSIYLGIRML